MTSTSAFTVRKYAVGVPLVELSGSQKELEAGALSAMNPIAATDWVEISLESGIDRFKAAQWLEFDEAQEVSLYDEAADWWPESQNSFDEQVERTSGVIPRFAFVTQDSVTWQVVQSKIANQQVKFLRAVDEVWVATDRFDCKRLLAYYAYHSDGPGPVSWVGSMAVLDVGDYLIYTTDGDSAEDDSAFVKPKNLAGELSRWLSEWNATNLYILNETEIRWLDLDKKEAYERALADLDEFSKVSLNITDDEKAILLAKLVKESTSSRILVDWLTDPAGEYADKMIAGIHAAVEQGSGGSLLYHDDLVAYFEQQEV